MAKGKKRGCGTWLLIGMGGIFVLTILLAVIGSFTLGPEESTATVTSRYGEPEPEPDYRAMAAAERAAEEEELSRRRAELSRTESADFTVSGTGTVEVDLPHLLTSGDWRAVVDGTVNGGDFWEIKLHSLEEAYRSENLFFSNASFWLKTGVCADFDNQCVLVTIDSASHHVPPGGAYVGGFFVDDSVEWSVRFTKVN